MGAGLAVVGGVRRVAPRGVMRQMPTRLRMTLSDWQLRQETELAGAVHLVVVDVVPRDQAILDGDDVAVSHPQLLPGQRRRSARGHPEIFEVPRQLSSSRTGLSGHGTRTHMSSHWPRLIGRSGSATAGRKVIFPSQRSL